VPGDANHADGEIGKAAWVPQLEMSFLPFIPKDVPLILRSPLADPDVLSRLGLFVGRRNGGYELRGDGPERMLRGRGIRRHQSRRKKQKKKQIVIAMTISGLARGKMVGDRARFPGQPA